MVMDDMIGIRESLTGLILELDHLLFFQPAKAYKLTIHTPFFSFAFDKSIKLLA
jgi:hypothetical protein